MRPKIKNTMKMKYKQPTIRIVKIRPNDVLATSGGASVGSTLGYWYNGGLDAWDGSTHACGSAMGGWTDNGGSAWE